MNTKFQVQGRAVLTIDGKNVVDFRPFMGGKEHSGGCTNAEWEIRGVVLREQDKRGISFTLLTGGCCSGHLIEAWYNTEGELHMGALLRMSQVPKVVIPVIFNDEGKDRHAMSYLVAHGGKDGDAVSFISWYENQGVPTELITAPASSLCGGTSTAKADPYGILTTYPQLFDLVEARKVGRGQVSKESMLKWASKRSNVTGAYWCDRLV